MASNTCQCCPDPGRTAALDFSTAGSGKGFLERIGVIPATRGPLPVLQPASSLTNHETLALPMPWPELLDYLDGEPPPDRGKTLSWPHPDFEAEEG